MKTKIYFISLFLFLGMHVLQAQIKGHIQYNKETIKTLKENGFDKIISNEILYIEEPGSPELPILLKSYLIPVDADKVTVNLQAVNKQKVEGQYTVYPAQLPIPVGNIDSVFVSPNRKIYDSETPFPNKLAEIFSDEFYLGYRIVTIRFYPVEYNPKAKELYVCNFDFTLDYLINTNQVKGNEFIMQTQSLYRYEMNKKNIKFRVENSEAVDSYNTKVQKVMQGKEIVYDFSALSSEKAALRSQSISVIDEQVPEYIIITNNTLKPSFQSLADWKTKKGIFTIIVTIEEINTRYSGSDLQEKIKNYLIDANSKWGTGLYVLLGGDINIIPSRYIIGVSNALSFPSDRYYSTSDQWSIYKGNVFNGNITLSIINILGRVLVSNPQEVTTYTNKIITYEKANGLGDLNYLKNNLFADAYLDYNSSGGLINNFHSYIKNYVTTYVPGIINSKFICDNANCTGNPIRYTGSCLGGNIELNHNNFLSCLNSGANFGIGKFHFIYHLDHSNAVSIGTSSKDKGENVNRADVDNLMNGYSYQIMLSGGCNPANFAYDCYAKHYLMNSNGGGVAFIGNTDIGWQSEYYQVRDFSNAIYSTTGYPSLGRYDIGSAFLNVCTNTPNQRWRLHLIGDPEMQIWTNVPQTLNVTISPTSIQTGQRSLNVTVSNLNLPAGENVLICLQKGTEIYETKAVSVNGTYTIPFTVETTGTMNVTVTGHNFFPVEKTVQITSSTTPNPIISSVDFIDNGTNGSIGNGNGQNDAGETIRLQVALKNNGSSAANNLTATLSTTSSNIMNILNNSSAIGSVAANSSGTAQFLYKIDKDAPEILSNASNAVQFKLDIKDASNAVWSRTFNIDIFASDLQQRSKIITTTASPVQFNIELQNMGQAPATGLTAILKVNNITSGSPNSYPAIKQFETKTATSAFQFTITSGYTYQNTPLKLEVTNAYGKTWILDNFTLTKPAIISGLDFINGTNNITLTWNAVTGATGYNIYRCNVGANDAESGSYTKLNTAPVSFRYFDDQSNLTSLTKYYYKVAAVSLTGMEGDAVRILTWTSYPTQGLFPIQMSMTDIFRITTSINAADVNNDGYPEIFTAITGNDISRAGYLIGLDHYGSELFDIDNNVTTYSGFAKFDASMQAPVAIGDLYATGENQIISVSREMSSAHNGYVTCHISEDKNGDHLPDMLWQKLTVMTCLKGAIIANVDNSSDGSNEIVLKPDGNSSIRQIQVIDNNGNLLCNLNNSTNECNYSATAVADLDGDGDKEIIAGFSDGVYIWHHNGTPYSVNPVFGKSGYEFKSSTVICDLDGDGKKEIVIVGSSTSAPTQSTVFAIKPNGTVLTGWGTQTFTRYAPYGVVSQEISVGDLNGDGNLHVVTIGNNIVYVWNKSGSLESSTALTGVWGDLNTPILADVDGDNQAEILVVSQTIGKLYAIKSNGTSVIGFPLDADQNFDRISPCVVDLDNDGKNEVIAATGSKVYVWKTNGNPNRIEWGSERHDPQNTGEYFTICPKTIIKTNTIWATNQNPCNDLIIESGTLTLNSTCTLTMTNSSMIIVRPGAALVIDGGTIKNANIKALSGSSVTLKNSGNIKLYKKGSFNICLGGTFDNQGGNIDITQ